MPKMPEKKTDGDMGSLVIKCKVCDGTGIDDFFGSPPCRICSGSGKIKAKKTDLNKGEFWNLWL